MQVGRICLHPYQGVLQRMSEARSEQHPEQTYIHSSDVVTWLLASRK